MKEYPALLKEVAFTRRHNAARNIAIGIISTIAIILACGYLSLVITFNGGIDGFINNHLKPEPNSSVLKVNREAVTAEINQSFDHLQNILSYNYYETATHDHCSRGSNNWKRSDGYAYLCSLRITKFYGFNGDFRQQISDFEKKINSVGWISPSYQSDHPCKKMLEEYYDPYPRKLVSDLPGFDCRYEKDGLSLVPEFAEKETRSFILQNAVQEVSGGSYKEIYDEKNFQDSSLVIKKITATDRFVIIIAIQKNYFQN